MPKVSKKSAARGTGRKQDRPRKTITRKPPGKKKSSTTARASKQVSPRSPETAPAIQSEAPPDTTDTQRDHGNDFTDHMSSEDIATIASAICAILDDAVALIACLPALKRVAQVIDECACPPDPAKNPPDWCVIVTAQVQRELEYAIRCVNHAIHRKLQQVAIIMGLDPCKLPHTSSCD